MLSESDCRILARACKICLHEGNNVLIKNDKVQCRLCGEWARVKWDENGFYFPNPTFSTADDWELVRVKVVQDYRGEFGEFIISDCIKDDGITAIRWWLTQSPEELCRHAADFIKSRPDLFPWVEKMMEV